MSSGIMTAVALICGFASLRLIIAVEKAQLIVVGTIGQGLRADRIVAMATGTRKLFVMKIAIAILSRLSNLMFSIEGMYQEKAIQKAILSMMSTVVTSAKNKVTSGNAI